MGDDPEARPHAPPPTHLVSREVLERVRRDLLARLLEPYRLFLEARRIPLEALRASAQDDHALVHPLHDLLNGGDPLLPPALAASIAAVDAVASDWGHEQLRRLDRGKKLPQERLGSETLAAIARLDHPELFAQVKLGAKSTRVTAYTEYRPKSPRPLPRDPARFAALGRALGAAFAARGRPPFCEPLVTHFPRESIIDFVFGRLPSTTERLTESLARTTATETFTQRLRAFFHHASGELGVQGRAYERETIRRLAGEHLLDDPHHFSAESAYVLDPFTADLDGALSAEGVPGVESIELREIWIRRVDRPMTKHGPAAELLKTTCEPDIRSALAAGATVEKVKLWVKLDVRERPATVEIEKGGKLDMSRSDERVVDAVRGALAYKGVLVLPTHARRRELRDGDGDGDGDGHATAERAESETSAP